VLSQLRARAAKQAQEKTIELAVGGEFGDMLVVRYGVLPVDELERYVDMAGKLSDLKMAIDMQVSACKTLIWREHGTDTDLGVRLDGALWSLLDWPLPDGVSDASELVPREVVVHLFGGNGAALANHLERLASWMQDPGGEAPGESLAAT